MARPTAEAEIQPTVPIGLVLAGVIADRDELPEKGIEVMSVKPPPRRKRSRPAASSTGGV